MSTYVIALGNAFEGFTLIGPFASSEEAIKIAEKQKEIEWNVVEVFPPQVGE